MEGMDWMEPDQMGFCGKGNETSGVIKAEIFLVSAEWLVTLCQSVIAVARDLRQFFILREL